MRIKRIEIEGEGPLAGTFHFPVEGLALWATPNSSGKSALAEAIVDAFYPAPAAGRPDRRAISVTLEVTLDGGESLVVTRELASGSLRVTTPDGSDVTTRFADSTPALGLELTGLTRSQFRQAAILGFDDLKDTVGNSILRTLLRSAGHRRNPFTSPERRPSPPAAETIRESGSREIDPEVSETKGETVSLEIHPEVLETTGETVSLEIDPEVSETVGETESLEITRGAGEPEAAESPFELTSPAEQIMEGAPTAPIESGGDDGDGDLEIIRSVDTMYLQSGLSQSGLSQDEEPEGVRRRNEPIRNEPIQIEHHDRESLTFADPDEPGVEPVERLRRMRAGIEVLGWKLEQKGSELQSQADRLLEIQGDSDRLGMLTGAQPRDMEALRELLDMLRATQEKKEQIRIQESRYHRELEEKGVAIDRILEFDRLFEPMDEREREFLDLYRRGETIRRGNLALIRSESRLEDSQLEEILRDRRRKQRVALVPLTASVLALFGSIFLYFFPVISWSATGVLAGGLSSAVVGAAALWSGRRHHERQRRALTTTLERKRAQVAELEKEGTYQAGRLFVMAEERSLAGGDEILEAYESWRRYLPEIRELERLGKEHHEVGLEIVKLHEKLGAFSIGGDVGTDPWNVGPGDMETLYREYARFFEVHEELQKAESQAGKQELELAEIEMQQSNLIERLHAILERTGIDPSRNLDEAIEIYARRAAEGEVPSIEDLDLGLDALESGTDPLEARGSSAPWCSAISARTEAILRRFLPEARDVEVDSGLQVSLRLDPRGPRLPAELLAECLSASSWDQVCLALRLAIVETLSTSGEAIPLILDDPLIRLDDARHDGALDFLVSDCSTRLQVVLLTAQGVRSRWFLHQFPQHVGRVVSICKPPAEAPSPASPEVSPASSRSR